MALACWRAASNNRYWIDLVVGNQKLQVMIDRVARGEHPHHPLDAKHTPDSPGLLIQDQLKPERQQAQRDRRQRERMQAEAASA